MNSKPPASAAQQSSREAARERLILALDLPSGSAALAFLDQLSRELPPGTHPLWIKIGLELFLAEGPSLLRQLSGVTSQPASHAASGAAAAPAYKVFLDLKLHDIPNTVAGAIRALLPLAPALLTVHALGGPPMLEAAAHAAAGSRMQLLAVTVLTSLSAADLQATGITESPSAQVEALARLAHRSGIPGLVCSPLEAASLRAALPGMHLVTPGIRPSGSPSGDQQRTSTPSEAIRAGASQLVVGRPVTAAADPSAAWLSILDEVADAALPPTRSQHLQTKTPGS